MTTPESPSSPLALASEFPSATDAEWTALVDKTLRGKPFDKAMQGATYDDIPVHGLYTTDSAIVREQSSTRAGEWDISAPHWSDDPKLLNKQLLDDLERGATSFSVVFRAGDYPGITVPELPTAFDGVYLNMCKVDLLPGMNYLAVTNGYSEYLKSNDYDASDISGNFGIDPIGTAARTGFLKASLKEEMQVAAAQTTKLHADWPQMKAIKVDAAVYHNAGGSEAQELAAMLSSGVAYLRALEDAGMALEDAASLIGFSLAADADQYLTIAKFRAARQLWAQVLSACGIAQPNMHLGAVSSIRMLTVKDPWVNILRATTACLGAGIGGADSITILPHDTMLGLPSDFARRIARNVQVILQEESGLSKVADPAAGSFALETLTAQLSDTAWGLFQDMEAMGGITAVLESGELQASIDEVWHSREKNISRRKDAVTGVSEFPDIHEKPIEDLLPPSHRTSKDNEGIRVCTPLPLHRSAESFESLRAKSDEILATTGKRPTIFMATIGTVSSYTARATFAKNFFEAGGIEAVYHTDAVNSETVADAYSKSGAAYAVICGSDSGYEEKGDAYVAALRESGCSLIYLAGKPANLETLKAQGLHREIFMECDVLATLTEIYTSMGDAS